MGYSTTSIPFFTDDITIIPHTATHARHIGKRVSIRQFAKGNPCSLERVDGRNEYIVRFGRYPNETFIQGPEA